MKNKALMCLFILGSFVVCSSAWGTGEGVPEDSPWERFSLSLGGFAATFDNTVTLGLKELGAGISVNPQDALGLDSSLVTFRADALLRLGSSRRHRLDLSYWDFRRDAKKTLEKDIEIGGEVFPIGTTVESYTNFQVIRGAYSYSLLQDKRIDLGLGLGLYVLPIEVGISGRTAKVDEAITAPLPTLLFRFDFAITPKLFLRQALEVFYLEINSFRGSLFTALIALEYKPWKHFGFGVGYNAFRVAVEAEGNDYPNVDFVGKIDLNYSGLLLYGKVFF